MSNLRGRTQEVRGVGTLHFDEGPEAGPTLVLLHGVTRAGLDWAPVLPGLAFGHRLVVVDQRGHGRSDRSGAGAYRVTDYVGDALTLLEAGSSGPAVVVGHSLGAMVAAAVAAEAPGRVRAVVLEDPPFDFMGERIGETMYLDLFLGYRPLAGSGRPVGEVAGALAEVRVRPPGRDEPIRLGDLRDAAALRFAAACLKRLDPRALDPILAGRWLDGYDVAGTLGRIRCPALFLQADFAAGGALPDAYAAGLASHLTDGVHVRLGGVGHAIHGSRPTDFLRMIGDFLGSLA